MCPHVTVGVDRMCVKLVGYAATAVATVSRPGLARPSTTLPPPAPPVVDGRHKAGHDTRGTPSHDLIAYAAQAGHPRPCLIQHRQSWMAGTRPAMTQGGRVPTILSPMRRRPAIHVLASSSTASRGWWAFAHHDAQRLVA